ncbi:MAG: hypothetical protein ACTSU5_03220 [Promethearchaeota archaeon]
MMLVDASEREREDEKNDGSEAAAQKEDRSLSVNEFVFFTSPRYYRLVFPSLKPQTKNGDLLAAMGELKKYGILAPTTTWEKIRLTPKGKRYKKMISRLMNYDALHVPQSNGLFDYRSEQGRRAIFELVRFFAAKFNLAEYFQYLNLPVFKEEVEKDYQDFVDGFNDQIQKLEDIRDEEGQEKIVEFLRKKSKRGVPKATNTIEKKLYQASSPLQFDLRLIKKFLQEKGLKRPGPLLNHFNSVEPQIFETHHRQFSIYLPELRKIVQTLEEFVPEFETRDGSLFADYFNIVNLPTEFFGFRFSGIDFASEQAGTFLNTALEGPKLFASQFSDLSLPDGVQMGDLGLIIFPISNEESIVVSCSQLEMLYYFTLPTFECTYKFTTSIGTKQVHMLSSQKPSQFGKLLMRDAPEPLELAGGGKETREEKGTEKERDLEERKLERERQKAEELAAEERWSKFSFCAASFFTICQIIAKKLTPGYYLQRSYCVFPNGVLSVVDFQDSTSLLTTISPGEVEMGEEIQKVLKKISSSVERVLDGMNL